MQTLKPNLRILTQFTNLRLFPKNAKSKPECERGVLLRLDAPGAGRGVRDREGLLRHRGHDPRLGGELPHQQQEAPARVVPRAKSVQNIPRVCKSCSLLSLKCVKVS